MERRGLGGRAKARAPTATVARWVCRCQEPPVLLGTYGADGRVHIKVRDRYWHVVGRVEAVCPRCGTLHLLDRDPANERDADPGQDRPLGDPEGNRPP